MTAKGVAGQGRRSILTRAAAVAAGALIARKATGREVEAADGDTIKVGGAYTGTKLTEVGGAHAGPAFAGYNDGTGRGVSGLMGLNAAVLPTDYFPTGVFGMSSAVNGVGVYGEATEKFSHGMWAVAKGVGSTALLAQAGQGTGIFVEAEGDRGVNGIKILSTGDGGYAESTGQFRAGFRGIAKGSHGYGLYGEAEDGTGTAVYATSGGDGVDARGSTAVRASGRTNGVVATGAQFGVAGGATADDGVGVAGSAAKGIALKGTASDPAGWAMRLEGRAYLKGHTEVEGRLSASAFSGRGANPPAFTSAGRARIPRGRDSVVVTVARARRNHLVVATLQGDAGAGVAVKHALAAEGQYTFVLTAAAAKATTLAYFVFRQD
jgi:hypothetical protein